MDSTTTAEAALLDTYTTAKYAPRRLNGVGMVGVSDPETLADILLLKFGAAWDRLWTDYTADYNPIWNVDGTETITETRDLSHAQTEGEKSSRSTTGNDTETRDTVDYSDYNETNNENGTDTTTHKGTQSGTTSESVGHGESIQNNEWAIGGSGSPTTSEVHSGTDTNSGNHSETQNLTDATEYGHGHSIDGSNRIEHTGTDTHDTTGSESGTVDRTQNGSESGTITTEHKRGGNIGVTMTQQMLEADTAYWTKTIAQFYANVTKMIIDEITYAIYNNDETNVHEAGGGSNDEDNEELVRRITPILTSGVAVATYEQETKDNG